ncbi:MAG: hypothetical protein V7638_3849 [Acidobacteriota bacterium]
MTTNRAKRHTTTLPDGRKVDVLQLQSAVAALPVENVPLERISGVSNKPSTGFSGLRYALCDPGIPGIADQNMRLLDGRHRYLRRRDAGCAHMPIRIAPNELIEASLIEGTQK